MQAEGASGDATVEAVRAPTVLDAFRHTAGFSYDGDLYDSPSLAELVKRLAARPLNYQPGTRWVYSFAHDVQARLVEVLSGQPFDVFVRTRILEPLGMTNVVVGIPSSLASRFPVTYGPAESGGLVPVGYSRADELPATAVRRLEPFRSRAGLRALRADARE